MTLYLGGDVGQDTFHLLHSYDLPNAREVRRRVLLHAAEVCSEGAHLGRDVHAHPSVQWG